VKPRQSNRPDRRIAPMGTIGQDALTAFAERLRYVGDARHKLRPGDYGFLPPVNPRPSKSACDDLRPVLLAEASALFTAGVQAGMVSAFAPGSTPKYVWAVGEDGQIYEAKTKPPDFSYHGYRLGDDERDMRRYVQFEWSRRCPRP
jgi:hypothetical protein